MSPLPWKKVLSAFQPVFAVYVSPAELAQMILTFLTINSGAVALADGLQKNDVPKMIKNTEYLLALTLAEYEVNLVNALFNSVQSVGIDINCVPHTAP